MKETSKAFLLRPLSITILSLVLTGTAFITGISFLELMELKTVDLRFVSRGPIPASGDVVMAIIDEKSLEVEGRWPWPRSKMARLVDVLSQSGARVIGFDIGFLDPDENVALKVIDAVSEKADDLDIHDEGFMDFMGTFRENADNDRRLAQAIQRSRSAVVLGHFFHMRESDLNYDILPSEIERRLEGIADSRYPETEFLDGATDLPPLITAFAPQGNLEILTRSADASGFFNKTPDADGVVRWAPLVIRCGDRLYSSLAIQAVWHFLGRPELEVAVTPYGVRGIQMGKIYIPTDDWGRMAVNHLGPPAVIPQYSIADILKGHAPKDAFDGKIVFIGGAAMGIADYIITPFSASMPGLALHVMVSDNILTQRFLTQPPWIRVFDLLAVFMLCLLTGFGLSRLNPLKGMFFALFLFGGYIIFTQQLFVRSGILLNMVYPLLGLLLTYVGVTVLSYFTEERKRRQVKKAFSQYVASDVIDEMLEDPEQLKLGGEVKPLTVLFSDLRGFTSYSEIYAPEELVRILSSYFTKMTEEIFNHHGALLMYIGDALMAVFGAPVESPAHAEQACRAALAMRKRLFILQLEWSAMDRPMLSARIGINTGPMLVGNLGSDQRFTYGVLGDPVNLASRLEGLNKLYGTDILIGENTAAMVQDRFLLRELDAVRVVGKQQAVKIFQLVGSLEDPVDPDQRLFLEIYAEALDAYRGRRWKEAMSLFEKGAQILREDPSCIVMFKRCRQYLENPPPEHWDGVYVATHK